MKRANISFLTVLLSRGGRRLSTGVLLFFGAMALSKILQVLYFEQQGALANFGLSYGAMAMAGIVVPIFWQRLVLASLGLRFTACLGAFLYGTGIMLRIFPQSALLCILSGAMAGAGAILVIRSVNFWLYHQPEKLRAKKQSVYSFSMALGSSFFVLLFAGLSLVTPNNEAFLRMGLMGCGFVVYGAIFFIYRLLSREYKSTENAQVGAFNPILDLTHLVQRVWCGPYERYLLFLGFLTGIIFSFIDPYMPVILVRINLHGTMLFVFMALIEIMGGMAQPFFSMFDERNHLVRALFCVGGIALLGLYGLGLSYETVGIVGLIIVVVAYEIGSRGYSFYTALVRMTLVGKRGIADFITIYGMSLLLGDMIGGLLAAQFYRIGSYQSLVFILMGMFSLLAFGYMYLMRRFIMFGKPAPQRPS